MPNQYSDVTAVAIAATIAAMPTWRCPHCGTPQAETARCWVCRRSSTACATCRHFRRAVAAGLGYCALDRRRAPLDGTAIRACWDAGPAVTPDQPADGRSVGARDARIAAPADDRGRAPTGALDFVEVGTEGRGDAPPGTDRPDVQPASPDQPAAPPAAWSATSEPGWSFWAELEG